VRNVNIAQVFGHGFIMMLLSVYPVFSQEVEADKGDVPTVSKPAAEQIEVVPTPTPPTPPVEAKPVGQRLSIPSLERVDPLGWNFRAGFGGALDPSVFWLTFNPELQLDKFLAIGPTVQFGLGDVTTYTFVSLSPRFTLPFSYFEWFVSAGAGVAYRDAPGRQFLNFLYEWSTGFEFYILKNLSVGGAFRANYLSSDAVEHINVVTGYLSGHF